MGQMPFLSFKQRRMHCILHKQTVHRSSFRIRYDPISTAQQLYCTVPVLTKTLLYIQYDHHPTITKFLEFKLHQKSTSTE